MEEIVAEFKDWLESEEANKLRKDMEEERYQVQELMRRLAALDKKSSEFTETILYGLLPYHKSKFAKRESTFPVFRNIKLFLKIYGYDDNDWNVVANMVYNLASKCQDEPNNLELWIKEFTADKKHSRRLQCGSISPILFCVNDSFPAVNSKVVNTYNDIAQELGWNDMLSSNLENYTSSMEKCRKLIGTIGFAEMNNMVVFDLFCWWYDIRRERGEDEPDEEDEHEGVSRPMLEDISYEHFLQSIDLESLRRKPHVLRSPERIKVRQLLQACQSDKWRLPNFQRYFDWKKTDIRDLLESIFRDYYVGSLLLWESSEDIPLKIIPIHGVRPRNGDNVRTEMIILDGQQRITSLYYAIKGTEEPSKNIKKPVYFYINFERFLTGREEGNIVILERKLSHAETIKKLHFPFYELERYHKWVDSFEDHADNNNNDRQKVKEIRRLIEEKLRHFIDEFEIPYITLPNTVELPQMADIFERINTRGKALSVFDILIATLSKYDIDLRRLWDDTRKKFPKMDKYNSMDKLPIYILQSIALVNHDRSLCGRKDLLRIYSTVIEPNGILFDLVWNDMAEWVNHAIKKIENMKDGYGVRNRKSLPYLPVIPILAALLKEIDTKKVKIDCNEKLDMWYWSTVFSEAYSSGVDTKITADYREMLAWFDDGKAAKSVDKFRREFHATMNMREVERENNAVYRGVLSLFAREGAPDFDTALTFGNASENDKHHIFPKKPFSSNRHINSILNITWLSEKTNRNIVKAKKPSKYIHEFLYDKYNNDVGKLLGVLEKHYINKKGYECMLKDDFNGFIKEREKTILNNIAKLVGIEQKQTS